MRQHRLQVPPSDFTDSVFPDLSVPQLPVPVFLPVTPESPDPTVKSTKETIQPETFEGELNFKSELKETQDERNKTEDRVVTIEGQRQGPPTLKGKTLAEREVK